MFRYINSCLILLASLLLTSILAGPQPWHKSIQDELGRNLSSRAKLILPEDKLWAVSIERWTTWSQPIVVASIEAATVKDVQLTVSSRPRLQQSLFIELLRTYLCGSLMLTGRGGRCNMQILFRSRCWSKILGTALQKHLKRAYDLSRMVFSSHSKDLTMSESTRRKTPLQLEAV